MIDGNVLFKTEGIKQRLLRATLPTIISMPLVIGSYL
jgi:hypothetical protein